MKTIIAIAVTAGCIIALPWIWWWALTTFSP